MTITIRASLLLYNIVGGFSIKSDLEADRMFITPLFSQFPLIYRKLHFEFSFQIISPDSANDVSSSMVKDF